MIKIGDMVHVEINGSLIFPEPVPVREIFETEVDIWVFVGDSKSGVLLENIIKV
jgi:hypothetical protein